MAELSVRLEQHCSSLNDSSRVVVEPGDEGHLVWMTLNTDEGPFHVTLMSTEARFLASALMAVAAEVER